MKSSLILSILVITASILFLLPGCPDNGGKVPPRSGYGEVYVIEPEEQQVIPLFDGRGSLVELYSPAVLRQMSIPAQTNYSLGYVEIPSGNSTPPHYLRGSCEIIYVISGHGKIIIDGISHELSAGQATFIPAGSVQSFINTGTMNLRYLTSVQPFYQYENDIPIEGDISNITYKSHPDILVSTPAENRQWNPAEGIFIHAVMNPEMIKLSDKGILPEYSIAIAEFSPGAFIPEHVITESNEIDYALEGKIRIQSGDNFYILKEGQAALVPKGTIRGIINYGENRAVLLSYVNPYWKEEINKII